MKEEIKRNDPCPCGSGKKYKKCCGSSDVFQNKPKSNGFAIMPSAGAFTGIDLLKRKIKVVGKEEQKPVEEKPVEDSYYEELPDLLLQRFPVEEDQNEGKML